MRFTRPELLKLAGEMAADELEIMKRKNADYTADPVGDGDPFANFRLSEVVGVDPMQGLLVRVLDKIQRIKCYVQHGGLSVSDETVFDAISDIRNYMVLLAGMVVERHRERD